jgi:hypothetical protein
MKYTYYIIKHSQNTGNKQDENIGAAYIFLLTSKVDDLSEHAGR